MRGEGVGGCIGRAVFGRWVPERPFVCAPPARPGQNISGINPPSPPTPRFPELEEGNIPTTLAHLNSFTFYLNLLLFNVY